MLLQALPLVFVLTGLALYTVLGGADLGAGLWQLLAGRGERGERVREYAHNAMAPVWEANHVWLIFVLTVFWTAYPGAFEAIAATLPVPLFIAALGIIFRGAAYAMRAGAAGPRETGTIDTVFSLSSILTPFALGAAAGAIATGRVLPGGEAANDVFSSWWNAPSIFIGVLAVASCAYLAAVYLAADAARDGDRELEQAFRARALAMGVIAGALAVAGIFVVKADSSSFYGELVGGQALPAVIVSGVAGVATLLFVQRRRFELARYCAALAVAALIAGWALARWPEILPGLSVYRAAAGHDTLVWVVVAVLVGGAILFPSLGLLFRLLLSGRFHAPEQAPAQPAPWRPRAARMRLTGRAAAACLIAGFGLLTVAEGRWEHAVGVTCLLAFVVLASGGIIFADLGRRTDS